MTVCLTGDVHHMSMETRDQAHLEGTEVEAALKYAEVAATHGVPVTLFCTGKCVEEHPEGMARLAAMDNVELGGHGYWAFSTSVHTGWRALGKLTGGRVGSWNGPRPFQAWEIRRTLAAFGDVGVNISAWRDHAYRHDDHTADLLAAHAITHFSDAIGPDERVRREAGLTVVPINTPPDHEHVYHAYRTPEHVAESGFKGPFGSESYDVNEWVEWVFDAVNAHIADGQQATVLVHPACMELADGFAVFERFCARLANYNTVPISDISPT